MLQILQVQDFKDVGDPVKTEETIYEQLLSKREEINTDYVYVAMPIAWYINTRGMHWTQNLINQICTSHGKEKLFFVCQHIQVKNLNFNNHLVFTPHATAMDSFIAIPHYACSYDLSMIKPWNDRQYEFSFVGSFKTHPVRQHLYDLLKDRDDCYIKDTGNNWHFEESPEKQKINRDNYIKILGNTKYSLCPRGTGPSSIRIWESMAMAACPVIVSNFLKMPLQNELDTRMWLNISEKTDQIKNFNVGSGYDNQEYWNLFSNDNLWKSVVLNFV